MAGGTPGNGAPPHRPGTRQVPAFLRGARLDTNVARLIVVVSIIGAVVSWRASEWSERASNQDEQATQDRIVEQQARAANRSVVAQDQRLVVRAEERYRQAELLESDARRSRGDARLARRLRGEARRRRREGETIGRFVQSGEIPIVAEDGTLSFNQRRAVEFQDSVSSDLRGGACAPTRRHAPQGSAASRRARAAGWRLRCVHARTRPPGREMGRRRDRGP